MKIRNYRSRRGGAVATFIGIFILLMVGLAIAHSMIGLLSRVALNLVGQDRGDCGTGGATSEDVASKSAVLSELHNSTFMSMVRASAQNTTQNLLRDTVMGYMDKEEAWTNWSLQYMPGAARWANTGFGRYIDAQVTLLQARALASGNVTEAFWVLEGQVSKATGVIMAGVDFVFLNSATGLRTYLETGNATQALCTTYASQLQQLWDQAFNPSLTDKERAHYLGQALAISTVAVSLAGADGVSSQFKAALNKVGLAESWETVKPYLGKIGSTVSAKAAYLTFTLLQKLAQRFPEDSMWVTGLTSDRMASMAELLSEKGFSKEAIEQRIDKLIQVAGDAPNEDDVAAADDAISLRDAGEISIKTDSSGRVYLYSDAGKVERIRASSLEGAVPGFVAGHESLMELRILKSNTIVYSSYQGGATWNPSVPTDVASSGNVVSVGVEVLTLDKYMKNLFPATLGNEQGFSFMPNTVELTKFTLTGNNLEIQVIQDPVEGISAFTLKGKIIQPLDFDKGDIILPFSVQDFFGETRLFKIHHDGHTAPWVGIEAGSTFPRASFLSFDGIRLRVVYVLSQDQIKLATIYMGDPSTLYALGGTIQTLPIDTGGANSAFMIERVTFNRQLERLMLNSDSDYIHGRLGAEVAYAVAKNRLGLSDVVIEEISKGGKDLYTVDGKVVIQARLLTQTKALSTDEVNGILRAQLNDLVTKLKQDFRYNQSATTGYAFLSYLDNDGVLKTIVVEIPRP